MKELIPKDDHGIFADTKDRALVDSRFVAAEFGKQHQHVLRDIENLDCSPEFNQSNFGRVDYLDAKGEKRPPMP